MPVSRSAVCPCGRATSYADCCGAIHSGSRPAITAEDLMRSRYTAFVVGDSDYLMLSWAPEAQVDAGQEAEVRRWSSLTIHETAGGGPFDSIGTVRFTAAYESDRGGGLQSENSLFRRESGRWVYVGPNPD